MDSAFLFPFLTWGPGRAGPSSAEEMSSRLVMLPFLSTEVQKDHVAHSRATVSEAGLREGPRWEAALRRKGQLNWILQDE